MEELKVCLKLMYDVSDDGYATDLSEGVPCIVLRDVVLDKTAQEDATDIEIDESSFYDKLLQYVRESGETDAEIYRKAHMSRQLFSRIRSNPDYHPGKYTVVALAIALKLSLVQTQDLLSRAGYAFIPGDKKDGVISTCIDRKIYNIMKINDMLYEANVSILQE